MNLPTLDSISDLKGKKVLVRVDWNVPIVNGKVDDDFRIRRSMPTLDDLGKAGAVVTLMTHLDDEGASIEPLRAYVPEGMNILENLRKNPGEKGNDPAFAESLAKDMDLYVNEAFSVSHREHASIVGVPQLLPAYAGIEFAEEVAKLGEVFNPPHPFLFILGGAKFETKLPLVNKFLNVADEIFIGGAMGRPATEMGYAGRPKITLSLGDITALDASDANIEMLKEKISRSQFVLWNGPLGKYEDGYVQGTQKLATALATSGKQVIVGGGDTLDAIRTLNLLDKFHFVSTGGGAMLDFLANGTLPGIEALKK